MILLTTLSMSQDGVHVIFLSYFDPNPLQHSMSPAEFERLKAMKKYRVGDCGDSIVILWDILTGESKPLDGIKLSTSGLPHRLVRTSQAICLSKDGTKLFIVKTNSIQLLELQTSKLSVFKSGKDYNFSNTICISEDANIVVTAGQHKI